MEARRSVALLPDYSLSGLRGDAITQPLSRRRSVERPLQHVDQLVDETHGARSGQAMAYLRPEFRIWDSGRSSNGTSRLRQTVKQRSYRPGQPIVRSGSPAPGPG